MHSPFTSFISIDSCSTLSIQISRFLFFPCLILKSWPPHPTWMQLETGSWHYFTKSGENLMRKNTELQTKKIVKQVTWLMWWFELISEKRWVENNLDLGYFLSKLDLKVRMVDGSSLTFERVAWKIPKQYGLCVVGMERKEGSNGYSVRRISKAETHFWMIKGRNGSVSSFIIPENICNLPRQHLVEQWFQKTTWASNGLLLWKKTLMAMDNSCENVNRQIN